MKQASWGLIALFVVVDYVLATLINLLFTSGVLQPIVRATAGLINRTLIGNWIALLVVVLIGMIWLGRLKGADLGLVWPKLRSAALFTVGLWLLVQIVELVLGLAAKGAVTLNTDWSQLGLTAIVGILIGHIFGNALYEDITYRGFLLPQVSLQLSKRWPPERSQHFIAALLISQLLFALRHIPGDILGGLTFGDTAVHLLMVLAIGILYALLYARTNNLFLVIGVHVLTDAPTPLFSTAFVAPWVLVLVFSFIAFLLWPRFTRKQEKRAPQEASPSKHRQSADHARHNLPGALQ
jgi:hypothetical protein